MSINKVLGNKFAFAATVLAFAIAQGWNAQQGVTAISGHNLSALHPIMVAHGTTIPPDPWAPGTGGTLVAHGTTIPPDPWAPGTGSVLAV